MLYYHDDVIKWKQFPRYWSFVRGISRSPVNSPHKGQWRRALMFSLICVWIDSWINNRKAVDLIRYRAHYDVILMTAPIHSSASPYWNPIHGIRLAFGLHSCQHNLHSLLNTKSLSTGTSIVWCMLLIRLAWTLDVWLQLQDLWANISSPVTDLWRSSRFALFVNDFLYTHGLQHQEYTFSSTSVHGSLTRYANLLVVHVQWMPGTFFPPRGLAIPTYITTCTSRTCRDMCQGR